MTTESSKNGAITLRHMNVSGYIGQATNFSRVLSTACCFESLFFGSRFRARLDLVFGLLVVIHTYLYYFPLSPSPPFDNI